MIGASAALAISEIPVGRPHRRRGRGLCGRRICHQPRPRAAARRVSATSPSAGTRDAVLMVEAGAKEVSEEVMLDAILFAHEEIKKIVAFHRRHRGGDRQGKGSEFPLVLPGDDVKAAVREYAYGQGAVDVRDLRPP